MPRRSAFGSIEKRGANVYRIKWTDSSGSRRSETVHAPKFVAQRRLSEIQLGINRVSGSMTYGEYWSETVEPSFSVLSSSTAHEYRTTWARHMKAELSDAVMASTTWKDVERVISNVTATYEQRKVFRLWRKIMNMAIRDSDVTGVTSNPVDSRIHMSQHVRREKVLLESQELIQWMRAIRGMKYEALLLVLAGSGMRPSEAVGMTWERIDAVEVLGGTYMRLRIDCAVVCAGNRKEVKGTKNASSTRTVLIGSPFMERLEELRASGYLVQNAMGEPTSPATIAHNYKRWCANNGVKHVTLENLRTSFSTMCGEAGCVDSLVDFQMGHAGATTRAKHYQVSTLKGLALVIDNLADYLWSIQPCGSFFGTFLGRSWDERY